MCFQFSFFRRRRGASSTHRTNATVVLERSESWKVSFCSCALWCEVHTKDPLRRLGLQWISLCSRLLISHYKQYLKRGGFRSERLSQCGTCNERTPAKDSWCCYSRNNIYLLVTLAKIASSAQNWDSPRNQYIQKIIPTSRFEHCFAGKKCRTNRTALEQIFLHQGTPSRGHVEPFFFRKNVPYSGTRKKKLYHPSAIL